MPRGCKPRNNQKNPCVMKSEENHGQPCSKCDGSCRLVSRGSLQSSDIPHPETPKSPSSEKLLTSVHLPDGEDHIEYGAPISKQELEPYLNKGPGAFCAPPWHINIPRLMSDINILFRCFATSSINVSEDSRTLRRILFDFYVMGFTRQRPSKECWEALLQLSPEQSRPLRATLRDLNTHEPYDQKFIFPPKNKPHIMFGEECDVSGSESEDDYEVYTSDDSFIDNSSYKDSSSEDSDTIEDSSEESENSDSETEFESDDSSRSSTGRWSTSSNESSEDELMKSRKPNTNKPIQNKRKLRSTRNSRPSKIKKRC
uniref:Transcriptional regulator ICP22 homolog n=1 Tax=Canid alphaherpesvirus 1 TaxID=170325 RepID=A0A2H4GZN7_9ALPH|nr:regulatory protein ICP22 [Canid alphaherpesvirus 1]ARE29878.1 regulatory protein ICP22 [Canid alphaherpesvirus 1]